MRTDDKKEEINENVEMGKGQKEHTSIVIYK